MTGEELEMIRLVLSFACSECFRNYEAHPATELDRIYGENRRKEITKLSEWHTQKVKEYEEK